VKVFSEEGARVLVEVLSVEPQKGDQTMIVTKLRAVRTLQPPDDGSLVAIEDGEEFEVSKRLGYESYVDWQLTEPTLADLQPN
jgi:hypothetical protein